MFVPLEATASFFHRHTLTMELRFIFCRFQLWNYVPFSYDLYLCFCRRTRSLWMKHTFLLAQKIVDYLFGLRQMSLNGHGNFSIGPMRRRFIWVLCQEDGFCPIAQAPNVFSSGTLQKKYVY